MQSFKSQNITSYVAYSMFDFRFQPQGVEESPADAAAATNIAYYVLRTML